MMIRAPMPPPTAPPMVAALFEEVLLLLLEGVLDDDVDVCGREVAEETAELIAI
jgi:hypothetical protein